MWKPIILDVECILCNKSLQKINHDPREVTKKMGKISNRRSRTPNWSLDEKQYLLELIKERKEVVVTQKNNGSNHSEEKDIAWNEILRALAARFGSKFSVSSIKKVKTQWQNMKRIAREEIALVGPTIERISKQTHEVCNILDLIQDGVLKGNDNLNETTLTTDVVIKAERMDEDLHQPSCSTSIVVEHQAPQPLKSVEFNAMPGPSTFQGQPPTAENQNISMEQSSSSSTSEQSDMHYFEQDESIPMETTSAKKDVSCMTEPTPEANVNVFHRQLQEFFRCVSP